MVSERVKAVLIALLTLHVSFTSCQSKSIEELVFTDSLELDAAKNDIPLAEEKWMLNRVDHFSTSSNELYSQRYFLFDKYWRGDGDPIFFYTGNEADVSLYVHATGLMWENAKDFNAALIFAEHRYYGKSTIDPDLKYLSHDQALADFASLLYSFQKNTSSFHSPIISFGGSYGGMLSAWFRFKYPQLVTGAIAGSAPIFAFQGMDFFHDGGNGYWRIVSETAGDKCASISRKAFQDLLAMDVGTIQEAFNLCKQPASSLDVALWIANAFDTMAMGEFPFKSNYLTGDSQVFLPPFPVKATCKAMNQYVNVHNDGKVDALALYEAVSVFYNASRQVKCFDVAQTTEDGDDRFSGPQWSMQWCSEAMPEEFYFTMTGVSDMFFSYNNPFSAEEVDKRCAKVYKTRRDSEKVRALYGSPEMFLNAASNIVFSNGKFDPWRSGGVNHLTEKQKRNGLHTIFIPNGAHHVDLMFSNPGDTADIKAARQQELNIIRSWISAHHSNQN